MNNTEVLITSDSSGELSTCYVFDFQTGTQLMSYKSGATANQRTLCMLANDYIVSADKQKPLLHVWQLNRQDTVQNMRFVCPGVVNALAVSPDANYCIAGVGENIYIWQISNGRLLSTATRHFQNIKCIKFTDDSSHFVSAGDDGMVIVWPLANLISFNKNNLFSDTNVGQPEPRYIFSDHSLPVSDLYVGKGGIKARIVSVSFDRTCKIYNLACGTLLLTLVSDCALTSVSMDNVEMNLFLGDNNGCISHIELKNPPRTKEFHFSESGNKSKVFSGHTKTVSCLSVSMNGLTLASGSDDNQVIIWHVPSRQQIRNIPLKGAVKNLFFSLSYRNFFDPDFKPKILLHPLQRNTNSDEDSYKVNILDTEGRSVDNVEINQRSYEMKDDSSNQNELLKEINKLKQINAELYRTSLNNLLINVKSNTNDDNLVKRKMTQNKQIKRKHKNSN